MCIVGIAIMTVQVKVDLKTLASECIPDLNLEEELQKQLLPSPPPSPIREKFVNNYKVSCTCAYTLRLSGCLTIQIEPCD